LPLARDSHGVKTPKLSQSINTLTPLKPLTSYGEFPSSSSLQPATHDPLPPMLFTSTYHPRPTAAHEAQARPRSAAISKPASAATPRLRSILYPSALLLPLPEHLHRCPASVWRTSVPALTGRGLGCSTCMDMHNLHLSGLPQRAATPTTPTTLSQNFFLVLPSPKSKGGGVGVGARSSARQGKRDKYRNDTE
jgi:hypothetical protein